MKMRYWYLPVRNLLITVLVCAVCLVVSEFILRNNSVSSAEYEKQQEENTAIQFMQIEKIPKKDLNTVQYIADYLKSFDANAMPATPPTYPLVADLLPSENSYESDTLNIVVICDSFGWGACSTNRNELFWRLLENDLREAGYRCRVYGVCYPGASSFEELQWLTDTTLVKDLNPDLVLFGFVQNDTLPDADSMDLPAEDIFDSAVYPSIFSSVRKLLPNVTLRLSNYLIAKQLEHDAISNDFIYVVTNSNWGAAYLGGTVLEKYKQGFLEPLNAYASNASFPVVMMTLPPYPDNVIQKALFEPLQEALQEYPNIAFYNSLQEFCSHYAARQHKNNYFVNAADFHPGSATHRFYADYIERFLKEDYAYLLEQYRSDISCETPLFVNEWLPWNIGLSEIVNDSERLVYTLQYPSSEKEYQYFYSFDRYFLNAPIGKNHIKLSFSVPTSIQSVEVTGEKSEEIELYYGRVNEKLNYDDHIVICCSGKTDHGVVWKNEKEERITSLYIHCGKKAFDGDSLTVTIRK